jgi:hypothetical protein
MVRLTTARPRLSPCARRSAAAPATDTTAAFAAPEAAVTRLRCVGCSSDCGESEGAADGERVALGLGYYPADSVRLYWAGGKNSPKLELGKACEDEWWGRSTRWSGGGAVDVRRRLEIGPVHRIEGAGRPATAAGKTGRKEMAWARAVPRNKGDSAWTVRDSSDRRTCVRAAAHQELHDGGGGQRHNWQGDDGRWAAQQAARALPAAEGTDATRQQRLGTQARRDAGSRVATRRYDRRAATRSDMR